MARCGHLLEKPFTGHAGSMRAEQVANSSQHIPPNSLDFGVRDGPSLRSTGRGGITNERQRRPLLRIWRSFVISDAKADTASNLTGRGDPRKTRVSRGRGFLCALVILADMRGNARAVSSNLTTLT